MRSMLAVVATTCACEQSAPELCGLSREATGPAAKTMMSVSGTRSSTHHVSRAEVTRLTCSFASESAADRSALRASSGTITVDSAPPSTSS